jgi:hypothetical protein
VGWLIETIFSAIVGIAFVEWLERRPKWFRICADIIAWTVSLALLAWLVWTLIH